MTEPRHPGDYVRQARTKAKLRQVDLAESAGLSQGYLSQIEKGTKPLKAGPAARIELACGVEKPYSLVRWAEDISDSLRRHIPGWLARIMVRGSATFDPRTATRATLAAA